MLEQFMLLPFVHGIDASAIASALTFAQEKDMALLLVSLIRLSAKRGKQGVRAEAVEQAYDFFEYMKYRAGEAGIVVKCIHISTHHVARSIQALAQEMACAGILLFVRDGKGVLLETTDIKQLLEQPGQPIYLFQIASRKAFYIQTGKALIHQLRRLMRMA